jgi:two-component system, NarL family, invasion response regulator UvrY
MTERARSERRVLIVDDQQLFRAVARSVVSLLDGWKVVGESDSGEAAIVAAQRLQPDTVVMDINLPGISGIDATRQILVAIPEARIVLVSTYAPDDLPADALASGARGYLRKEEMTPRALHDAVFASA